MRRLSMILICAVFMFAASGCQSIRRFDQWKCDKYGICMFGVQPSCRQVCPQPACPQPVFEPAGMTVPPPTTRLDPGQWLWPRD